MIRLLLCLTAAWLAAAPARAANVRNPPGAWQVYSNATYVADNYNDGDSFHVQCGEETFIFRFYFIDCPEADFSMPDRVKEQSDAFGTTSEQVARHGLAARDFVRQRLAGKPFELWTRRASAMGRSKLQRYYGLIRANGSWLHVDLLQAGLARVKGVTCVLPDGTRSKEHLASLAGAESAARTAPRGVWAPAPAAKTP